MMMMMVLKTSMPSVEETEDSHGMLLENSMARLGVVIAVCAFVLNSMEAMLYSWKVPDISEEQENLEQEISHLKHQAAVLNTPETFAASAKSERKALALEKDLARIQERRAYATTSYLLRLPALARYSALFVLIIMSCQIPVVTFLPPSAVWPLGKWLAAFSGSGAQVGAIGLIPWALLCHRVTKAFLTGGGVRR